MSFKLWCCLDVLLLSSVFSSTNAFHPLPFAKASSSRSAMSLLNAEKNNNNDTNNPISISDAYDGGNIEFVKQVVEKDGATTTVHLRIKPDPYTELEQKSHFQYFSFRSTPAATTEGINNHNTVKYVIDNAAITSYASAWDDYTVFYTNTLNDPDSWKRKLNTRYDKEDGTLTWSHNHIDSTTAPVYFCYFPPYTYNQHLQLIEQSSRYATSTMVLGKSLDGRDIDCIQVGTGGGSRRICWIIHRQHPGEHMAEYFAEGLLNRLLGLNTNGSIDGLATKAKELYTFYIVPNMCPDGAVRGHLRTNAVGANLNREWATTPVTTKTTKNDNGETTTTTTTTIPEYIAPTMERSPEVYCVLEKMKETGCDAFLDVHGDEALPFNFLAQPEVPNWGPRLESIHGAFVASYQRCNSDVQQKFGYEVSTSKPSSSSSSSSDVLFNIACDQVAYRFDCFSATLEMPFKDCRTNPDPERGWNPARARQLGASVLDPLVYIHPYLREDTEFWENLPAQDAYICPTSKFM